jgi:hypothetical protein
MTEMKEHNSKLDFNRELRPRGIAGEHGVIFNEMKKCIKSAWVHMKVSSKSLSVCPEKCQDQVKLADLWDTSIREKDTGPSKIHKMLMDTVELAGVDSDHFYHVLYFLVLFVFIRQPQRQGD